MTRTDETAEEDWFAVLDPAGSLLGYGFGTAAEAGRYAARLTAAAPGRGAHGARPVNVWEAQALFVRMVDEIKRRRLPDALPGFYFVGHLIEPDEPPPAA